MTPRRRPGWFARRRWPLLLAAAAAAVRLIYLAVASRDPLFHTLQHLPDAAYFDRVARDVAAGDWLGGPGVFAVGPLYAYFLAAAYAIFHAGYTALKVVNVALDAATACFIYGFARRAFDERAARLAGVIWVVYLPAVFFTAYLLPVSLGAFLVAASFYFLARAVDGRLGNAAVAGGALGLLALDRPNVIVCAAAAVAVFAVYRKTLGWRKPLAWLVAFAVPVGLSAARNYAVTGEAALTSGQGGITFYIGNSPGATGVFYELGPPGQARPEALNRDFAAAAAEKAAGRRLTPGEVSRWWLGRGVSWMRENPGDAARLYGRKLRLLANDLEVGSNEDFYAAGVFNPLHRVPLPWFGLLLPLAAVGFAAPWRRAPFPRVMAAAFVATYGLSVLVFFVCARYRMPAAPLLAAFAGAGVALLYDGWRGRRWGRAAFLTAVLAAAAVFANWPVAGFSRHDGFGRAYVNYGKYYLDRGEYGPAAGFLKGAAAYNPGLYDAYLLLAVAYDEQGELDEAAAALARGVRAVPASPQLRLAYGAALVGRGRAAEAVPQLREATRLEPANPVAWHNLGVAYFELGRYDDAAAADRRALALSPDDGAAWLALAEALFRAGKADEAYGAAARAAALDASLPGADLTLGTWYYGARDYGRAAAFFQREITRAPTSLAARRDLAQTYRAAGDAARARAAYRDYLAAGGARDADFERAVDFEPY